MALTGAQKGIEEPGTQSSMHSGGAIQENVVVKIRECNAASKEVRRVFRSRRQRPAIQVCLARSSGSKVSRHSGTQALPLREIRFPGTRDASRLRVSFGAFWLHHSIYNSPLLGYKGLLWYQGAGLDFLQ